MYAVYFIENDKIAKLQGCPQLEGRRSVFFLRTTHLSPAGQMAMFLASIDASATFPSSNLFLGSSLN